MRRWWKALRPQTWGHTQRPPHNGRESLSQFPNLSFLICQRWTTAPTSRARTGRREGGCTGQSCAGRAVSPITTLAAVIPVCATRQSPFLGMALGLKQESALQVLSSISSTCLVTGSSCYCIRAPSSTPSGNVTLARSLTPPPALVPPSMKWVC